MALTIVRDQDPLTKGQVHTLGDLLMVHGTIQFDNSYPTNGEAVVASDFRLRRDLIDLMVFPTGGEIPVFDKANSKIKLFTADGTEAANASDQSAVTIRYVAIGR